jgi:2',3'-cyclic-nucleotide 2'-phosphodiesterase (5'-nucleotidase family)
MGGLARRVSYIKAFKHRSNLEVPTLFVDAGNIFTDDQYNGVELPADVMTKNKWVVKGYGDYRHDAANIAHMDLPYLAELLKNDGYDKRVEEYPFIQRLISANVRPVSDQLRAPVPYVIKEITLQRSVQGKKLRIGILGLTETKPPSPMAQKQDSLSGFAIDDPFETAKRVIADLKNQTDFIVVLAYMTQEMCQKLASENPEINTIIGARQLVSMEDPQHIGSATIAYAYNQTKYVGEMRVYVRPDGSIENQVNRYIGLDSIIPDDAAALETVNLAHTEFTNDQSKKATAQTSKQAGLFDVANSPYAGSATCAGCHAEENEVWERSGHAHAMATLERKNEQFDNECVGCHVVGFQKSGGFQSLYTTPNLANVQCESCHGPGRDHTENPAKGYGFMQTPVGCVQCHTKMNSPDFQFESYWAKIKH